MSSFTRKLSIAATAVLALGGACQAGIVVADIDQVRQRFAKSSLSIWLGDSIRYINHDDVRHNIQVIDSDGRVADYGLQDPEKTITVAFVKGGTFTVRCSIHQSMRMRVTVYPQPALR